MKNFLLLISVLFCYLLSHAQIPESMIGNWINNKTNEWEYGFFEDFAIYDSDFWDYDSIENKNKKTIVTLRKNDDKLHLELSYNKQGNLLIDTGKKKDYAYRKMGKIYPAYETYEAELFPNPNFLIDSAIITGYYRHFDKIPEYFKQQFGANHLTFSFFDPISDEQVDYLTTIDSLGRFKITVPLLNTREAYVDWKRLNKLIILEPGDRQFLFADMLDLLPRENDGSMEGYRNRQKEILFMGKNSRLNNELMQYKPLSLYVNFYGEQEKELKGMDYFHYCEDVYNQKRVHYDNYIREYPTISEKFRFYTIESDKYDFAGNLMQYRFKPNRLQGERLPDEYIEYVNYHFPLSDKRVYTLSRSFWLFLRDYIGYEREKEIFSASASKLFEMEVLSTDSILANFPLLKDLWLASVYHKRFDQTRLPLTNMEMSVFNDRIQNPYYKERLLKLNNYYLELQQQPVDNESSLKETAHLNDILDMEELFNKLTEPYRGKVVYVDFWGTWCGPCRRNMQLMPDIKKELEGEDIVFMYFANNSPEQTWKSIIKEMELTGENIVHYRLPDSQQRMLENHFSINSFPTYMIINRRGDITNANASSPDNKEELLKELNNCLKD